MDKAVNHAMRHCNGCPICAIDIETTGLQAGWHEIIELAIIPLDANLEPRRDVLPFDILMKPDSPERIDPKAMSVNKIDLGDINRLGFDRFDAIDMLDRWITGLKIPPTKFGTPRKIMPLGHNYGFDFSFISAWLGMELYNEYFHHRARDTAAVSLFLNDRAAFHAERVPFSKNDLQWIAKVLNVETDRKHRALEDALTTARVYRELCRTGVWA